MAMDDAPHDEGTKQFSGAALSEDLLTMKSNVDQTQAETGDVTKTETEDRGNMDRLQVVSGLTEAKPGQIEPGEDYRFLITAAVQSSPSELGTWLSGDGQGFRGSDRPVNTSLIDREHNWTFAGENGFILTPPEDGADVIAAKPLDIGSNDLDTQPIQFNADELLGATAKNGYNQVNIASGRLEGVYIRQDEQGQDLGNPRINEQLRASAEHHGLPVVEIPVEPILLEAGATQIHELEAKEGSRLWKISLPSDGVLHEIDVIRVKPGETPKGMQLDKRGFDLRIQQLDGYGSSTFINADSEALGQLRSKVEALLLDVAENDREALEFTLRRIDILSRPTLQGG